MCKPSIPTAQEVAASLAADLPCSPYLAMPLRTLEQARADIAAARANRKG